MDIILVTDDTRGKNVELLTEAYLVKATLHFLMDIKTILVTSLVDAVGLKRFLKSRKIVFFFQEEQKINNTLIDIWLNKIQVNNGSTDLNYFVACVGASIRASAVTTRYPEGLHKDYKKTFDWLPYLLEALFGRSGKVVEMPTIENLSKDKNVSKAVIEAVIKVLACFGIEGSSKTSPDRILLFCDREISEIDTARLRNSKLAGTIIHAFNMARAKRDISLEWIANWHWTASDVHAFIVVLMIEMQLICVDKRLVMHEKVQACPITSPIKFQKVSGSSIALTWEAVKSTDTRITVKKRSESNMEWITTARELNGFSSTCDVNELEEGKKYQFSLTAESIDETTEPALSDWVAIEINKSNLALVKKTLLVLLWIFVLLLNIVQCCLILVIVLVILVSPFAFIFLIGNTKLVEKGGHIAHFLVEHAAVKALCIYGLFLITFGVVPWFMFEQNDIFVPLYVLPLAFLLFWSIIGNIICRYVFKLKYGVLSLQSTIWDIIQYRILDIELHQYTAESMV